MIVVSARGFNAVKARDQITRVVRQQAPVEDANARTEVHITRDRVPSLNEATWEDLNAALPDGWEVTRLNAKTFTVEVAGRRA